MATSIVAPSLRQVAVRRLQASSKQATSAAVLLVKTCHEAAGKIISHFSEAYMRHFLVIIARTHTITYHANSKAVPY